MDINKYCETIENFNNFLQDAEVLYKRLLVAEEILNDNDFDIKHNIENSKFNACQGFKITSDTKKYRKIRRQAKNRIALLEPFVEVIKRNKSLIREIAKLSKEVNDIKYKQEHWTYRQRVKPEDLQFVEDFYNDGFVIK